MRVDVSQSRFHEDPDASEEFDELELRRCRLILRRLRFLEQQVRENGGLSAVDANGGAGWAEWEVEALEWVLTEVGFLQMRETRKGRQ